MNPLANALNMASALKSAQPRGIAASVRRRIERGGERLWRLEDFRDLPFVAVAQSLSRLTREGSIERLSKGVYFRSRETALGKSRPKPAAIQRLAKKTRSVFPASTAAANFLGFGTQSARCGEVATSGLSLPRKLIGADTVVHTHRPEAWAKLSDQDAALLDFLRQGGKLGELSPEQTAQIAIALIDEGGRFERLLGVAATEPPRVRAMLGAIGTHLGKKAARFKRLRASLNPFSKFNFGMLAGLPHASEWQAKEQRFIEAL